MNKIKKALLLALSLAMSATLFAACKKDNDNGGASSSDSNQSEISTPVDSENSEDSSSEDSSSEEHTHAYSVLKYDETNHWYECECGAKDESTVAGHDGGTATCTDKAVCTTCEQAYGELNAANHASDKFAYVKNEDGTYNETYACCGAVVRTLETETKTFTITSVDQVTCSDANVTVTMNGDQLFMNGTFTDTFTLTFTLPETYVAVTSFDVANLWTNSAVTAWMGTGVCTNENVFINGQHGWSNWTGAKYQATSAMMTAAGYNSQSNQVSISVSASGGNQLIFLIPTFTYEVEHSAHNYNVLKYDETNHWYECVCGEKDENSIAAHEENKFTYAKNEDGTCNKNYACCGAFAETIETLTKTFTVTSADQVTCSDESIAISVSDGQLTMNSAAFTGTPFTLTITLPDTYVAVTSLDVANVWTNDGGAGTVAWVGTAYDPNVAFIGGTSGWGGAWVNSSFQATSAMMTAAGYNSQGNQVIISVQPNAGSQVILLNLTFTYEVVKAN